MRGKLLFAVAIAAVFVASHLARRALTAPAGPAPPPLRPERIVSLAPSVTETLFALGLGERVVGVSSYCSFPPETARLPKVGGYFNPNYEAVLLARPDLVLALVEHAQNLPALEKLGLNTLAVNHQTVEGILASLPEIGRACAAEDRAAAMVADLRRRMDRVQRRTAGLNRPRVLFVIDRVAGGGAIRDCYVAGAEGYFDRIIALAGGENVCRNTAVRYPVVSGEGIVWMNPEVIFDLSPGIAAAADPRQPLDDWRQLGQAAAVRTGRVHAVSADYAFRPGPRFILLVEALAQMMHPEGLEIR
jgi:iron complex transport system substrate-binding protein